MLRVPGCMQGYAVICDVSAHGTEFEVGCVDETLRAHCCCCCFDWPRDGMKARRSSRACVAPQPRLAAGPDARDMRSSTRRIQYRCLVRTTANMIVTRSALRYGSARLRTRGASYACYSSLSSSLKISSVPAPHSGSITVVSLNRPAARNALSRQLLGELSDVIEGLHREGGKGTTRALVISSESDASFCAGADLKERLTMSSEE